MQSVYFSSVSENTHRFVAKVGAAHSQRIPLTRETIQTTEPFILITPTYGGGGRRGADVPKQVIRFLNDPDNRALLRGVVASGNTNFGADFCRAGHIIAEKCGVPLLHTFELLGNPEDVSIVKTLVEENTYVPS